MAPLTIRPAAASEAAQLTELAVRSKGHWGYDADFMRRARPELAVSEADIEGGKVHVAERDARPVGLVTLALDADPPELAALFVEPAHIGRGVGATLLDHALERARVAGVASLVIESDPNAEAFYLARGAVRVGARRSASTGRLLPLLRMATGR